MFGKYTSSPDKPMSRKEMEEMLQLAESMAQPHINRLQTLFNTDQVAAREGIVKLIMALGFGIAATQLSFFGGRNSQEFGAHVGRYISETIGKLQTIEEELDGDESATAKPSAWDIH